MTLEVTCDKCKVSQTCPARGSSPLYVEGKMKARCQLVGGHGKTPVQKEDLSPESLEKSLRDGPCLTIAQVPRLEDGYLVRETVKIFSHPVTHEREKVPDLMGNAVTKSHS